MKRNITILCIILAAFMLIGCSNKTPEPPRLNSLALDKTSLNLKPGEKAYLKVTSDPVDYKDLKLTWTSSDNDIATVQNGKVTAIRNGRVQITAEAEGKSAICNVTIKRDIPRELREKLLSKQADIRSIYLSDEITSTKPEKAILVKLPNNEDGYTPLVFVYANENTYLTEKGLLIHSEIRWDNPKHISSEYTGESKRDHFRITYDKKTYEFQDGINEFHVNRTDNADVTLLAQQNGANAATDGFAYAVITKDAMYYPVKAKAGESSYAMEYKGKTVGIIQMTEGVPIIEIKDPVTNRKVTAIMDTK